MDCAVLAGRIGRGFERQSADEIQRTEQFGVFHDFFQLETAEQLYRKLLDNSIELVRAMLVRLKSKSRGEN